jgi:DNA invertase Pin-like site-specific DNA recombinase
MSRKCTTKNIVSDKEIEMMLGEDKKRKRRRAGMDIPAEYEDQVSELLVQLMMADQKEKVVEEPVENKEELEVTRVSEHRISQDGVWQFKVHFKGELGGTWIDDADCDCEKLIRAYFRQLEAVSGNRIRTIYCICRVSSKNQTGPQHISLEAQEQRLLHTVHRHYQQSPLLRVKMFKISSSAYHGIPTVLQRVGESADAGDAILTYRVDRLSRNIVKFLSFLEDLNDRGVQLYAQDENIWYHEKKLEFIQGILDANKESVIIGKRVKLSLESRRRRGDNVFGSVPFGYKTYRDKDNRVLKMRDVVEQNIVRRIERELVRGLSSQEIANNLNAAGVKKRGRRWSAAMVLNTK